MRHLDWRHRRSRRLCRMIVNTIIQNWIVRLVRAKSFVRLDIHELPVLVKPVRSWIDNLINRRGLSVRLRIHLPIWICLLFFTFIFPIIDVNRSYFGPNWIVIIKRYEPTISSITTIMIMRRLSSNTSYGVLHLASITRRLRLGWFRPIHFPVRPYLHSFFKRIRIKKKRLESAMQESRPETEDSFVMKSYVEMISCPEYRPLTENTMQSNEPIDSSRNAFDFACSPSSSSSTAAQQQLQQQKVDPPESVCSQFDPLNSLTNHNSSVNYFYSIHTQNRGSNVVVVESSSPIGPSASTSGDCAPNTSIVNNRSNNSSNIQHNSSNHSNNNGDSNNVDDNDVGVSINNLPTINNLTTANTNNNDDGSNNNVMVDADLLSSANFYLQFKSRPDDTRSNKSVATSKSTRQIFDLMARLLPAGVLLLVLMLMLHFVLYVRDLEPYKSISEVACKALAASVIPLSVVFILRIVCDCNRSVYAPETFDCGPDPSPPPTHLYAYATELPPNSSSPSASVAPRTGRLMQICVPIVANRTDRHPTPTWNRTESVIAQQSLFDAKSM